MTDLIQEMRKLCEGWMLDAEGSGCAAEVISLLDNFQAKETKAIPRRPLVLDRPLACVDLEATDKKPETARVCEVAVVRLNLDGTRDYFHSLVNPETPMTPEAAQVTGLTDAELREAPAFGFVADDLFNFLQGCALTGYNFRRFDGPLLVREFYRTSLRWSYNPRLDVVDAFDIFKLKEPRDLPAAVRKYLGRDHNGGHRADADARATLEVLEAQVSLYQDLPADLAGLAAIGADKRIDIDGKFVEGEDGKAYFAFGKHEGQRCSSQIGYLRWMVEQGQGFHPHTVEVANDFLSRVDRRPK